MWNQYPSPEDQQTRTSEAHALDDSGTVEFGDGATPALPPEPVPVVRSIPPGTVIGASVVACVQAGFVLVSALALLIVEMGWLAICDLLLAGGLIAGAVTCMTGKGRWILLVSTVLNLVACVAWLVAGAGYALWFAMLPIVTLMLMLNVGVSRQ